MQRARGLGGAGAEDSVAWQHDVYDVIIIGAGVVGSFIARALSRYRLRILLLDKAATWARAPPRPTPPSCTPGYDAKPGTLQGRLNVAGNALFEQVCGELDVDFDRCGTYVVGRERGGPGHPAGAPGARPAQRRARPGAYRRAPRCAAASPASPTASSARCYAATGGIVDPFGLCIAAAESAVLNGVELRLETEVTGLLREGERIAGVGTDARRFRWRRGWSIAAGLWADDLMR